MAGLAGVTALLTRRSARGLGVGVSVAWSSSAARLLFGVLSRSVSPAAVTCAVLAYGPLAKTVALIVNVAVPLALTVPTVQIPVPLLYAP